MLTGEMRGRESPPVWIDGRGSKWVLVMFLLAVPPGIWWSSGGGAIWHYGFSMPDGQVLYLFSKLAGLYAFVLLCIQILGGLGRAGLLPVRPVPHFSARGHRTLGLGTVFMVLLHVGLFVGAVSMRKGHFAYGLLLPDFFGGHYKFMVSLGWLGGLLLLGVVVSGFVRAMRTGGSSVHQLALLALALVVIHAQQIGSEVGGGMLYYLSVAMGVLVAWGVVTGVFRALGGRR